MHICSYVRCVLEVIFANFVLVGRNYLLTYILSYSMSRVLLEKLTGSAASQEIPLIF